MKKKNKKFSAINKPRETKEAPTPERVIKGDLRIGEDGVFRSASPFFLDDWLKSNRLGPEPKCQDRYYGLLWLIDLAAESNLISSGVADPSQVGLRGWEDPGEGPCSLDSYRGVLRLCPQDSRRILADISLDPMNPGAVSPEELCRAADDLVSAKTALMHKKEAAHVF